MIFYQIQLKFCSVAFRTLWTTFSDRLVNVLVRVFTFYHFCENILHFPSAGCKRRNCAELIRKLPSQQRRKRHCFIVFHCDGGLRVFFVVQLLFGRRPAACWFLFCILKGEYNKRNCVRKGYKQSPPLPKVLIQVKSYLLRPVLLSSAR